MTKAESEIAQKVTHIALVNASSSFSILARDNISFQQIELNPTKIKFNKNYISAQEYLYILLTEFTGGTLAESFLVLNPNTANQIASSMFPQPNLSEEMKDATLLELDNILAASVATKFSDILQKDIKGDVPQLIRKNFIQAQNYINERLHKSATFFSSITLFQSDKLQIEAQFICTFTEEFKVAIKEIIDKPEKLASIEKMYQEIIYSQV